MGTLELLSTLDTAVEILTVAVGVVVLLLGWRILPRLSFSFAAVLFLLSEFVEAWEAIYGQSRPVVVESWITVVAKDATELLVSWSV